MGLQYFVAYGITATVFLALDFVWLSQVAKQYYWSQLGDLLLERPNIPIAALFYLVFVVGVVIFAVAPALKSGNALSALVFGALFGFFAYATYDITNLATLKSWSLSVTIVDIVWGTALTAVSAFIGCVGTQFLLK